MGNQRIDYNHRISYLVNTDNAVGPTTSLSLRTLDNPSPTTGNAIWLAMPGTPGATDAGANTTNATAVASAAVPVATLEKAIDVMQAQPTRTTIHIIRNSYVGTLSFAATDAHTSDLITNMIVQVENGETATILFSSSPFAGWGGSSSFGGNTNLLSGLKLNGLYLTSAGGLPIKILNGKVRWCQVDYIIDTGATSLIDIQMHDTTNVFTNNRLNGRIRLTDGTLYAAAYGVKFFNANNTVQECIFENYDSPTGAAIAGVAPSIPNKVVIARNCDFVRCRYTYLGTSDIDFALQNSIVWDALWPANDTTGDAASPDVTITNSLINYGNVNGGARLVTVTDCLQGINPLFYDVSGGDYHLQDQRQLAPDSMDLFAFTSKAVYNPAIGQQPGDNSLDLGPYIFGYTLIQDEWRELEWDNEFWNDKVTIEKTLTDYDGFEDLRGNFHRVFDAPRRKISFTAINDNWTGTKASYDLLDLIEASGAKRWYPRGDTGVWDDEDRTVTQQADDSWLVNVELSIPLVRNSFNGFICHLASGANDFYLRIRSHDTNPTLGFDIVLEDHRENQLTMAAGVYDITCLYLPVEVDQAGTPMVFENWDPQLNPLMRPGASDCDIGHQEGNVRFLTVRECEIDE